MSAVKAIVLTTWMLYTFDPLDFSIYIFLQRCNMRGTIIGIVPQVGPALALSVWPTWHLMDIGTGMCTLPGIDSS